MKHPLRLFCAVMAATGLLVPGARALIMRDSGPEPLIVQIKESLRTSDDLDAQLDHLADYRQGKHLKLEKWWAGSKLLMLVSFPADYTQQQAIAVLRDLQQSPAVEKVVPYSAQNLEFRSGDFARDFPGNAAVPDVARRGFDKERLRRRPEPSFDNAALAKMPHAPNRLIVRWKDEYVWKADQTGFRQRMADFHRNAGCRVVKEERKADTKLTHVLEFDDPDSLADKLKKYSLGPGRLRSTRLCLLRSSKLPVWANCCAE